MDADTILDLTPEVELLAVTDEPSNGVPVAVEPEITTKVELAMQATAKMVEDAFTVAQARALGAYFDSLVEIAIAEQDDKLLGHAKRAMMAAVERLRRSREGADFDKPSERQTLYATTAQRAA